MVATVEQIMTKAKEIERLANEFTVKDVRPTQPGISSDFYAMLQSMYTGTVQAQFEPLLHIESSFFDPIIEDLEIVARQLSTSSEPLTQIDSLRTKLGDDWTGHTATAFFNDYVNRNPVIVANQYIVAKVLVESMKKNKEVYEHSRNIMLDIATRTRDAMQKLVDSGPGLQDFKVAVSIVALIGAGAATAATFGAAAPAAGAAAGAAWAATAAKTGAVFSVIAASGTVAAEGLTKEAEVKGNKPVDLLASMTKALQAVSDQISHNTQRIVKALGESRATAHSLWRTSSRDGDGEPISMLVVKRPKIADVDLNDKGALRKLVMPDDD